LAYNLAGFAEFIGARNWLPILTLQPIHKTIRIDERMNTNAYLVNAEMLARCFAFWKKYNIRAQLIPLFPSKT